jgi:hypothetical protein
LLSGSPKFGQDAKLDLETGAAEAIARAEAADPVAPVNEWVKPKRQPLPERAGPGGCALTGQ